MGNNAANSQWLTYSGRPTDEWSGGIATFSNGDIATAFSVSNPNGGSSVIIQRLSTSGAVIWSLDIGADYAPGAGSVLVGKGDNIYVVGGTKKGATGESGKNDSDVYAAAISSAGQRLWYKNYGIGIHEIGSQAVLDTDDNIILIGRVSEVNDGYSFIKDVENFYGAEFSGGWRGFQLKISSADGSVAKAYTTGSINSGGELIAVDQSRNIVFVGGYTFGAVNGVNTVGNGDPAGANKYLIARNETSGAILWTRMENWVRSNIVVQEEDAIYFVDKGVLEKVKGSTGETIWTKAISNADYVLSSIAGGGILLSESESSGNLTIRRFDSGGTETGSQVVSHTGKLYPRTFIEKGDGIIQISGSTTGTIEVSSSTTVTTGRQSRSDSFVLQVASAFSSAPTVNIPFIRGNSLYTIVDGPSWTEAEANSVKLGGHLVSVKDAEENLFIGSIILANGTESVTYWIGLTDSAIEGEWQWSSGESLTYTNWSPGEPNANDVVAGPEDYAALYATSTPAWFDISNGNEYFRDRGFQSIGIAETPFIRHGDSAYVIVQGPTWEEAEANAQSLGGHLVTINDAEENDFLIKNNFKGWIGLTDKRVEGQWEWSSGQLFTLDNWIKPIFNRDNAHPLGQDYVYMDNDHEGIIQWDSVHPSQVQARGIAEIKLAPNNTPTGTPTLSGNFKAGQVITIDRTPVQDADNFTGYNPDFKYSWEIANDPGMTMMIPIWESLNTADATDGNQTFTITADLTGKLIRGVVSYLDRYGTNEIVKSLGSILITTDGAPNQTLAFTSTPFSNIRQGVEISTGITYDVSNQDIALTGVAVNLFFDSSQIDVLTDGNLFQKGLQGSQVVADSSDADGNSETDSVLSISYADFNGDFPGDGIDLPLILANLKIIATDDYTGTSLFLAGVPATGYVIQESQLDLGFNAAPVMSNTVSNQVMNRGDAFSYSLPGNLFTDEDSEITINAQLAGGENLPEWLSFDPTAGSFTGTSTSGGSYDIQVSASDELGSVSTSFTLTIREVQSLSSTESPIRFQRGQDITVPVNYSTTDGSQTPGLSFRVHYDSSLFSFDPSTGISNQAQADLFQIGTVQQDTEDFDGDASTDRYIPINIVSFTGVFPTGGQPTKLADLTLKAADLPYDSITGLRTTAINFSEQEAAQGYGFASTSATLTPLIFNLDVDGDGKVTALGDGLMIIRKMFGSAFAGDALTNKAISPNATRTSADIHQYIQDGVNNGFLDVDKDGKTTALGDGLMVIRHLFGPAFAGDALISKAISPDSPYFGNMDASSFVADNIDALRPLIA
jgi:hypothetical protein